MPLGLSQKQRAVFEAYVDGLENEELWVSSGLTQTSVHSLGHGMAFLTGGEVIWSKVLDLTTFLPSKTRRGGLVSYLADFSVACLGTSRLQSSRKTPSWQGCTEDDGSFGMTRAFTEWVEITLGC